MTDDFALLFRSALARRASITNTQAVRVFSGAADGIDGVFVDRYGPGAVLIVYEGRVPYDFDANGAAQTVLDVLGPQGVTAVYVKPFARDRSKLGGEAPVSVTSPKPAAGEPLPEHLVIDEHGVNLEVRLYDGWSTGLFLDQRDNRAWVRQWCAARARETSQPPAVLNTFAYTCAFSVYAALGGATTTSVDVSPRYLDWGKYNFDHNGQNVTQEAGLHRFARMDTFEFCAYARRKAFRYDLIVLDPPSFAAGSKKKKIAPWSSVSDYARLIHEATWLLTRGGVIFASTNTSELCRPGRFEREIEKGLGRRPRYLDLPAAPLDFARDRDRFVARAFA